MKFIPYTEKESLDDWIQEVKKRKPKRKQFSSKVHKNLKNK